MKEVKEPKKPLLLFYVMMLFLVLLFNEMARPYLEQAQFEKVDYSTFMDMIEDKDIGRVEIQENQILFTDANDTKKYRTGIMNDPTLADRLHDSGAKFTQDIKEQTSPLVDFFMTWVLPILIFFAIGQYFSRKLMEKAGGGGSSLMFGMGGKQAKIYVPSSAGIHFKDVAGEDEAKENLSEIVDYLHNPQKYSAIGAQMPKGVLLVGPPGTGKTMLAKAVAGEADVPFFSIAGSEFVEMFVGMGASKVRELFKQAKEKAPCIVFIDEIDAIGQKRSGNLMGNDEREQTLNQLLTEMDGFEGNNGVIILAVHAQKIQLEPGVDLHTIARMAAGASGAELANIVNEGALRAVRNGRSTVRQSDLEESVEVVIAGYQKKNAILSDKEKRTVAYHEIGHALVAALQTDSAPVQKITIIPRTSGALGYTMQVEQKDKYILTREELENKIATFTGGRAAEEVKFGQVSTGAANDIEQATKLARAMITRYGMSEEFDMVAMETVNNKYLGGDTSLTCSAATQQQIDKRVVELVKRQHDLAKKLLEEHRDKLDELATYLYEKETITGQEFMDILKREEKPAEPPAAEGEDVVPMTSARHVDDDRTADVGSIPAATEAEQGQPPQTDA